MFKLLQIKLGASAQPGGKTRKIGKKNISTQGARTPTLSLEPAALKPPESADIRVDDNRLVAPQQRPSIARTFQGQLPISSADLTAWQKLIFAACMEPNSEFNKVAQTLFPGWNQQMRAVFFEQDNHRHWSMLPNARTLVETFLADTHGPLSMLDKTQQFADLESGMQYAVRVPEAREQTLKLLRNAFGSNLYFHGSDTHKWHQIVTQGLEPKSGTHMMTAGAFHGHGVYVATDTFLSRGFMGGNAPFFAMGLVEVIHDPRVSPIGNALVVPEKLLLQLKYLVIYPNVSVPDVNHLQLGYSTETMRRF